MMKSPVLFTLLLASRSLAQVVDPPANSQVNPSEEFLAQFLPSCHDDSYCESGVCLTGDNPIVNNDEEYYFCQEPATCDPAAPRTFDGICNNVMEGRRLRGSTGHSQLIRIGEPFQNFASPRDVSDVIGAFPMDVPNTFGASTLLVMFGQFVDHDITIIHMEPAGSLIIPGTNPVPDMVFQPSEHVGEGPPFLRNDLTSYVDLSQVYGSDNLTAQILRDGAQGTGELLSMIGDDGQEYLPLVGEMPPAADEIAALGFLPNSFASGDIRVNEHLTLISWHTLFLREHNRLARQFARENPDMDDEGIFQMARKWNIAQYQNIVFNEYFDAWHRESLPSYQGYDPDETPDVDIWFSSASYRFGHSGVPNWVLRIQEDGTESAMPLGQVFFRPSQLIEDGGIDTLLKGAARQCHERIDTYFQEGLRNALFNSIPGLSNSPAMDLYTLNVQRGRDHMIGSYPAARAFFSLSRPQTFDEVTGNRECVTELLEQLYGVDNVAGCDPLVCGLAEPAAFGEIGNIFFATQRDHFARFRNADRFYFQNTNTTGDSQGPGFTDDEITQIRNTFVADIIARNTFLQNTDPADVENFIRDGFTTDRCCRTDGNPEGNNDMVCAPPAEGEVTNMFTPVNNLAQCDATTRVRAGTALFPGSRGCDCDCNCQVALDQNLLPGFTDRREPDFGGLGLGGLIGLIVGVVVALIAIGVLAWVIHKRRMEAKELDYTTSDQMSVASGASNPNNFGGARSVHSEAPSVNNYF